MVKLVLMCSSNLSITLLLKRSQSPSFYNIHNHPKLALWMQSRGLIRQQHWAGHKIILVWIFNNSQPILSMVKSWFLQSKVLDFILTIKWFIFFNPIFSWVVWLLKQIRMVYISNFQNFSDTDWGSKDMNKKFIQTT